MTKLLLAKQADLEFTEQERNIARRVIFGMVDGVGAADKRTWRRIWNFFFKAGAGEFIEFLTRRPRSGPFHRRHMLIEQRLFDAQERLTEFKVFRDYMKLAAGHVIWVPGGSKMPAIVPLPLSISYTSLDEDAMQEFHAAFIRAARDERTTRFFWPHLKTVQARIEMIESILGSFDE